jgi:FdhE protein
MFNSVEHEVKLAGRKLADLRKKTHIPAQLLDLVGEVLAAQNKAREGARLPETPQTELASLDHVVQGAALLAREHFRFDAEQAARLFVQFGKLLSGMGGGMAQAAGVVLEEGEPLMSKAFDAFLKNDEAFFEEFGKRFPQAPKTLSFLAQSSMTPSIMALAENLSKALPQDRTWEQGSCPVCGSLPFLSSLTGKEGLRVSCCSFCRSSYRTFRLQCAYCQERDAAKLPFFTADEEPGYRVDACLSCKGYIKTTDFREFDRPSLPVLDDLESLALDILAVKRGFIRPTASALGF